MKLASQIVLVLATLAAVAGGAFLLLRDSSSGGIEIVLPTATPAAELRVHVSGAVRSPGVYAVNDGDRLADAIAAAGGADEDADLAAVNLAVRVKDEDHWHIPRVGEASQVSSFQQAGQGAGPSGKIDLNSADLEMLKSLPGIGDVKAQAIILQR